MLSPNVEEVFEVTCNKCCKCLVPIRIYFSPAAIKVRAYCSACKEYTNYIYPSKKGRGV